ncbi:hypothetical protein D3879_02380 [Pseudomonas cavernicola]|uniref:Uncharacterized protein n=1 Tax=Pseudomonas cavernicola TaxID=2320866 RepID=A0A418XI81_9PSED|nr:hypothetical protein [Pseudomonas cavernicola]RJG12188.1 hypothetical protein D3879_02380 [Pseudomonas cavernicola]
MMIQRAKNLTDADIEVIVKVLDGWEGKLTWELLIEAIESRVYLRYTRQALFNHERIRLAFQRYKGRPSGEAEVAEHQDKALSKTVVWKKLERLKRLEAENARLLEENNRLLEQFVVWAYNAHLRGLDEASLSRPLPRVGRDQTVSGPTRVRKKTTV